MNYIQNYPLRRRVKVAILSNNITAIKEIMDLEVINSRKKYELELQIFQTAHFLSMMNPDNDKILKYLIFDYNIDEKNSLEQITDPEVSHMFKTRELNKELNNSLEKKQSLQNKVIKL